MSKYTRLAYIAAIAAALGTFTIPAATAKTLWENLNESAPNSLFDTIHESVPVSAVAKELIDE